MLDRIPVGPKAQIALPDEYRRLSDLAYNLWWSWDDDASSLFSRLDSERWVRQANPITVMQAIEPTQWEALVHNDEMHALYETTVASFDKYMTTDDTWFAANHPEAVEDPIAYLCAEFGVRYKLRLYSGGLGVLAGDHVKAASDLGVPLVAVGLFYRRGYFQQTVDPDGYQQHTYEELFINRRPVREVVDPRSGGPMRVKVTIGDRDVAVGAWRVAVGRVPLLLLDTDLPENHPADRPITHALYVRGREMRLNQEIVLGIGSVRLLEALGIAPSVWHVNEGHAALSLLERVSKLASDGATMEDAMTQVKSSTLFTLHTPVPAGNESFDLGMALGLIGGTLPHVTNEAIGDLSQAHGNTHELNMGALAIRLSAKTNGVSKRHGEVASHDWGDIIGGDALGITNGIHPQTWVGRSMSRLYRKHVGDLWNRQIVDHGIWETIRDIPNADIWAAHQAQKQLMLRRVRARLRMQRARHGESPAVLRAIDEMLPDGRLTIVFARRFATYKRASLIFSDPHRIRNILTDPDHPVQIIFAGKAHPADREGQGLVKWVNEMSNSPDLAGHVFFLENYAMDMAATLVRGADVWLNNPLPPKEASGTSGMKAAANGGLNLSVLDGWWDEGFNGVNGWGFSRDSNSDAEDAGILYHLLEAEVVPRYFERDDNGIPQAWVDMMKESIVSALPQFSTQRMLVDYAEKAYLPIAKGARTALVSS